MVGHLEDLDLGQPAGEKNGIDVLLHVAGQEEPVRSRLAEQDDRQVVDRLPGRRRPFGDRSWIGPQDAEADVVHGKPVAGGEDAPFGAAGHEGGVERLVARARPEHARLQDEIHRIPADHGRQARRVVLVRVGEDDDVDSPIPGGQVLIEGDEEAPGIRTAVDEQPTAPRALEEDGVSLPDVEHGQPGDSVGSMDDGNRERDDGCGQTAGDEASDGDPTGRRSPC